MKKVYQAPVVTLERFVVNDAVAACPYTSETSYDPQRIDCVVNGTEYVFYDGCTHDAGETGKLVTSKSNGKLYFVWYDGVVAGQPTFEQQAILQSVGITTPGWHAGPATSNIISIHNHS